MIMERLKREVPDAQNVTKVRITASSKEDVERAVSALAKGWNHHQTKKIIPASQLGKKEQDYMVYCIMLWN